MKKLMKFTAFALAVVMLVPLFASCMSAPPKDSMLKQITLTALLSDKEGVDCTSGFAFAGDGISKGVIEAGLTVSPKFDYRLGKTADGITLTPTEPLEQNTVYTFKLAGSSQEISRTWAFQTKRPFKIDKVSPENGGERVSCRAGIEIVSSHLNSEIAPFVTIYPPVAVEREVRGYKTIIRPKNSFKPNTTYSVKIDKKAKSPFGDELGEDYVFSFTTDGGDRDDTRRVRLYNDYAETFLPDENPVVEIYLANGKHEQELAEIKTELTVYKITEEQYITAIKTENDREFAGSGDPAAPSCDVSGITPLYTEQADIPLIKSYNARAAVPLPEALPKGLYAVSLKVSDKDGKYIGTTQKLLQITDVSFYSQSVNGETLIWLNSSETGKPVVGANIEYTAYDEDGTIRTRDYENGSKTDTYGRYIFNPNEGANETAALIKVTLGGKTVYCGIIDLAPQAEKPLEELYYAAVHTDRTIYLPTDTVSFWGTVFPRSNKAEMPKEVKAYLIGQNNSSYYYQQPEVIAELTLPLDADGVFAGSIPFEKLRYSDYRLKIMPAEAELDIENAFYDKDAYVIENVWVTDYEKPLYKTSAEAVKPFFTADEPINLNFTANFYDGTPATELEVSLNAYYGGSDAQQNIKTSGDGVAEAVYNVDAGYLNERKSWRPTRIYNYFELAGIENSYQYGKTGMASFLPRDIMLNLQYSDKGETGALTLTANRIDTSKIKLESDIYKDDYALLKGEAIDVPIKVRVVKHERFKVNTGSYYDPVNKVTVPTYSRRVRETVVKTYDISTLNGTAYIDNLPKSEKGDVYYTFEADCADMQGRPIRETAYSTEGFGVIETGRRDYFFVNTNRLEDVFYDTYDYQTIYIYDGEGSYTPDDKVSITTLENGKKLENTNGTVLYSLVQDKHLETGISKTDEFSFSYKPEHMPNMTVAGAYFDGRHVFPIQETYVNYDCAEKQLSFEVTPDKAKYAPGETVNLTIKATDAKGKPAEASLSVGVVDEAVYDAASQYYYGGTQANLLTELYRAVYSYNIVRYASYIQHIFDPEPDTGGGKGGGGMGGGDNGVRDYFKDTAQFMQVKTDKNGMAQVSFTLPDNLTSWRVTTAGITSDKSAGESYINIDATLPLFVSPIYSQTYIQGDEIAFASKAYGKGLKEGAPILFRAKVTDSSGKASLLDVSTVAGNYAMFNFGKLPCGEYKVMFSATSGGATDAVEHSFSVEKSGLQLPISKQVTPADLKALEPTRYPIQLSFGGSAYGEYMQTVASLNSARGERADEKIACYTAQKILCAGDPDAPVPELDISEYISVYNGGLRVYSYDYTDAVLTALAVVASPELFNKDETARYFRMIIEEKEADRTAFAAAIMGLAALGEPVLTDARSVIEQAGINDSLATIYLGVALAYLGDTEGANEIYQALIKPCIVSNEVQSYYDTSKEIELEKAVLERYGILPVIATDSDDYVNWLNSSVGKGESLPHRLQPLGKGAYIGTDDTNDGSGTVNIALTARGRNLQRTAAAMLISMKLGLDDTDKLIHYIRENSSYDVATLLEQTAYINSFVPASETVGTVTVKTAEGTQTLDLGKTGRAVISLNAAELKTADITMSEGIDMRAFYIGSAQDAVKTQNPDFTVEKQISWADPAGSGAPEKGLGGTVNVTVTVKMNENAPTGVYDISEWVPSNLRFRQCEYDGIWLKSREKQRLNLTLYHSGTAYNYGKGDVPPTVRTEYRFSYTAKYVTEGICRIDSTYVTHKDSGITAVAPPIENCKFNEAFSSVRTKSH